MCLVYFLQSKKDNTYYTGYTNNIWSRLSRHNRGNVESTRNKIPWRLVNFEFHKPKNKAK